MSRFAHIADCHIGAWRDQKLRELNLSAFENALDRCVQENVDFVIISGDLFDATLPDLVVVQRAVQKIKEVKDKGIQFYLTYGSHDFAPNSVSMVDILNSTGLFQKVVDAEIVDDKLKLKFITDAKTGAKIAGLSGRKLGLEKKYFEILDIGSLEKEEGFKIFVFHNAITEIRPSGASYPDSVPISYLPKGFNYYAGGHIHDKLEQNVKDYGLIVYPGPPFGATFTDLEDTAQGEMRGFFIIDFDGEITKTRFIETKVVEIIFHEINADKKTVSEVDEALTKTAKEIDVENRIILLKVVGALTSGRPSDINFSSIKQILIERGAAFASINHYSLSTEERVELKIKGESLEDIESKILADIIGSFKVDPAIKGHLRGQLENSLSSANGITLANSLLNSLKMEQREGETKRDFEDRVLKDISHMLGLEAFG